MLQASEKMLPLPAEEIAVNIMKMEFLRRGSRRWYFISALVFGIAIFIHPAPQRFSRLPDIEPLDSLKVPVIGCDVCDSVLFHYRYVHGIGSHQVIHP